jgi:hypothetical protein
MADPRLVQALEYILNHSDESTIEVVAEAVVRRRRELTMFGSVVNIPDPQRLAKEISAKLDMGIGSGIGSVTKSVRDMTARIIREHAPELNNKQVEELCQAWIPQEGSEESGTSSKPSRDILFSMTEQFISFSRGTLSREIDKNLRDELGDWPKRYWNVFPQVIRLIITDFLKDRISEEEFYSKLGIALEL